MRNLPNVYSSYCPGSPVVNGTPGSLLETYRQCLVTGTTKVAFSKIKVASGIATIDSPVEGQVYYNGSRIQIEGCDEPNLNVVVEVDSHTVKTFSFKTIVADGEYGGQIKINQPGAGWQILYSGTNEAVFISGNLDSLGVCIKIFDINAYYASIEVYESMSSLTVGINRLDWPSLYDNNRTYRIFKSGFANALAQPWWLVADNTNVYISIDRWDTSATSVPQEVFNGGPVMGWGQFQSFVESEKKNFIIFGMKCYTTSGTSNYDNTGAFSVGYYANTTPSDAYNHCCILTDVLRNTRGWIKGYISAVPAPFINEVASSGKPTGYRLSYKVRPSFLVTDYVIVGYGPQKGTLFDSLILGTFKETKFYGGAVFGNIRNFSIEVINGKRFINLPINNSYSTRSSANLTVTAGMIPMLVGESWSD